MLSCTRLLGCPCYNCLTGHLATANRDQSLKQPTSKKQLSKGVLRTAAGGLEAGADRTCWLLLCLVLTSYNRERTLEQTGWPVTTAQFQADRPAFSFSPVSNSETGKQQAHIS